MMSHWLTDGEPLAQMHRYTRPPSTSVKSAWLRYISTKEIGEEACLLYGVSYGNVRFIMFGHAPQSSFLVVLPSF